MKRLVILTIILVGFWSAEKYLSPELTRQEMRLRDKVLAAQNFLWNELERRGIELDPATDPYHSGFIGVEWSMITTTFGDLSAKQCSTDPLWAVQALRWFDKAGLSRGDRIVVLASSSFPGLLYSVLSAAEEFGLRVDLALSLGASTWGANRPEAPWPVLAGILTRAGFLRTEARLCTLGGEDENASGMPEAAKAALIESARQEKIIPWLNANLEEAIAAKMSLIRGDFFDDQKSEPARLVVNIGGAEGSMGENPDVLRLATGWLTSREDGGDGAIGRALREGYTILHFLNLRDLADRSGIDFDIRRPSFISHHSFVSAIVGLVVFAYVLATHQRWKWLDNFDSKI